MEDCCLVAEYFFEIVGELGCEGNFWNQYEGLFALFCEFVGELKIDFGFA